MTGMVIGGVSLRDLSEGPKAGSGAEPFGVGTAPLGVRRDRSQGQSSQASVVGDRQVVDVLYLQREEREVLRICVGVSVVVHRVRHQSKSASGAPSWMTHKRAAETDSLVVSSNPTSRTFSCISS